MIKCRRYQFNWLKQNEEKDKKLKEVKKNTININNTSKNDKGLNNNTPELLNKTFSQNEEILKNSKNLNSIF